MKEETVRKMRIFLAWQDEAEENWLRELSKQGLHLFRPNPFGIYTFRLGSPRDYVYRLDFRNEMQSSLKSYYQLFEEAGWEHVGVMGGWQYWRKPYNPAEAVEIYSDPDSKIEKYKRLMLFLLISIVLLINSSVNILNSRTLQIKQGWIPVFLAVLLLALISEFKLYQRIRELKRL